MLQAPVKKEIKLPIEIPTPEKFKNFIFDDKGLFIYEKEGFSVKCQSLFYMLEIQKQNTELPIYRYYYETKNLYLVEKTDNIIITVSNYEYWRVSEFDPITNKLKEALNSDGQHILTLYDISPRFSIHYTSDDGLYYSGELMGKHSKTELLEYYTELISSSHLEPITTERQEHAKNIIKILEEHNSK